MKMISSRDKTKFYFWSPCTILDQEREFYTRSYNELQLLIRHWGKEMFQRQGKQSHGLNL